MALNWKRCVARHRLMGLLAVVLLAGLGQAASSSALTSDSPTMRVAPNPQIVLASGEVGHLDWTMEGLRLPGHSAGEPCIRVTTTLRGSGGFLQGQTSCGAVSSFRTRPLGSVSTSRRTHTSVLGLAFGLDVRKLRIEKINGSIRNLTARRLDSKTGDAVGLRPFAYVAIVSRGDHCYRRIVGFSRNGGRVFELRRESCS